MYSIGYHLNKLEAAGLQLDVVTEVRALVGRPLLPADFDQRTRELAEQLAAAIADGSASGDEIAAGAAAIDARRGGERRAITSATRRAREILDATARRLLAAAGPKIVRELDRRSKELRDQVATATAALTAAGVLVGDMDAAAESMLLGPATAGAWAQRQAARDALVELAVCRRELSDLGLIPAQTAAAGRADRRAAGKAERAERTFGQKVAELMPGAR